MSDADWVAIVMSGFAVGFSGCAVYITAGARAAAERAARRAASAADWVSQGTGDTQP